MEIPEFLTYGGKKISTKGLIGLTYDGDNRYDIVTLHFENKRDRTFKRPSDNEWLDKEDNWEEVKNGNIRNK